MRERMLRMLGLHREPLPELHEDPELQQARREVAKLHRKADKVLEDYAIAEQERMRGR